MFEYLNQKGMLQKQVPCVDKRTLLVKTIIKNGHKFAY